MTNSIKTTITTTTLSTGNNSKTNKRSRRKGAVLIWATVAMTAFVGMVSLGVEWGHVQLVKTELQATADGAARAGAGSLSTGSPNARKAAQYVAGQNLADGTTVDLKNADVEIGYWDTRLLRFTPLSGQSQLNANAVHVIARREQSRGNAVQLPFTAVLNKNSQNVKAESVAMLIPAINVDENVRAQANPFLAGTKKGTVASPINPHHNPDYAGDNIDPRNSPTAVNGLGGLAEGMALNFDSISGTARHDPNMAYFNPDGEIADIGHNNVTTSDANSKLNRMFNENGIADAWVPINSLVGIFMDDSDPTTTPAPANLDFRSDASREFTELKPQLKQVFFIGDGSTKDGLKQNFIVPKGATRLFLATWDFYEWNNNAGVREVKVSRPQQIITVK